MSRGAGPAPEAAPQKGWPVSGVPASGRRQVQMKEKEFKSYRV